MRKARNLTSFTFVFSVSGTGLGSECEIIKYFLKKISFMNITLKEKTKKLFHQKSSKSH